MRTEYHLKPEDMQARLDAVPVFKSGFGDFPELAQNEYTIDQMQSITAAQDNLKSNIENIDLA